MIQLVIDLVKNTMAETDRFRHKMAALNKFMDNKGLSVDLKKRFGL
jgi:hypothetical protein